MVRFTHIVTLALATLLAATSNAQYEPKPEAQLPAQRHSIGLNFTPAAVLLMNGQSVISRFSLAYSYQRVPHSRFRAGLNYEVIDFKDQTLAEATIVAIDGQNITYHQDRIFNSQADVRAGLEWHRPDQVFAMVYGVDLFLGVRNEQHSYVESTWTLTSEGFQGSGIPNTTFSHQTVYAMAGMDVSIGQQIRVKENLRFELRWTPEFSMAIPVSETISTPELRTEPPLPKMGFRPRGVEAYVFLSF